MFRKKIIALGALLLTLVTFDASANAATHHAFHRSRYREASQRTFGHREHRVHFAMRFARGSHSRHAGRYGVPQIRSARAAHLIREAVGPTEAYTQASVGTSSGFVQVGRASYYGGRGRTANGGAVGSATCAHRSLPFGTRVLVTNLANHRQAVLTVNDRGPFVGGRVVDVSVGAANTLGMLHAGVANVRVQVVGGAG